MIGNIIDNIESTVVFVAFLSVLILVHEWGHFITAKRLGITVERFALGFGPKLFSKFYNGTNYLINAIPLGGYVKMAGDERVDCKGDPGEFYSKSVGRRSLVVLNGPIVNFLLAYVSFVLVFMIGYPGQSTVIAELVPGGPAQVAGLEEGDKIVAVNSRRIYGWLNLEQRLEGNDPEDLAITVLRDGEEIMKTVTPEIIQKPNLVGRERDVRDIGIDNLPNIIGGFAEGYPAEAAGLKVGDRVVVVDNQEVSSWKGLHEAISGSTGKQIVLRIVRDGKTLIKAITPKIATQIDENGQEVKVPKIGIAPWQELDRYQFGPLSSLRNSFEELWYITALTYESLFRIITGAISAKESVAGPVGIFYIVKGAAEEGISPLLYILGVISASLAIFNLLPLIPLDGGHLFLFGLEKARGKALSAKVDDYIGRFGFGLIILLGVFVFYNDFSRFGWLDQIGAWFSQMRGMVR